jgi:hypothetical protein
VCLRRGLRPAAAAGDRTSRLLARADIAKICLLRAAPGVGVRDPHRRASLLLDFGATHVTNENGLSSHGLPPLYRLPAG